MTKFKNIFSAIDNYIMGDNDGNTGLFSDIGFEVYPTIANETPIASNNYLIYRYIDSNRYYNTKDMSEHMSVSIQLTLCTQNYDDLICALNIANSKTLVDTINYQDEHLSFDLTITGADISYNDGYYICYLIYNFEFI